MSDIMSGIDIEKNRDLVVDVLNDFSLPGAAVVLLNGVDKNAMMSLLEAFEYHRREAVRSTMTDMLKSSCADPVVQREIIHSFERLVCNDPRYCE